MTTISSKMTSPMDKVSRVTTEIQQFKFVIPESDPTLPPVVAVGEKDALVHGHLNIQQAQESQGNLHQAPGFADPFNGIDFTGFPWRPGSSTHRLENDPVVYKDIGFLKKLTKGKPPPQVLPGSQINLDDIQTGERVEIRGRYDKHGEEEEIGPKSELDDKWSADTWDLILERYRKTITATETELENLVLQQRLLKRKIDGLVSLDEEERRFVEGVILENKDLITSHDLYADGWQYDVLKRLGQGAWGIVDLCFDKRSHRKFVRKRIPKKNFEMNEVKIPLKIKSENIVEILGFIRKEDEIEVFQEDAGMSLKQVILNNQIKSNDGASICNLTYQALCGLRHLHRHCVIHNDIKPDNLCIVFRNGSAVVKIVDFGSARTMQDPPEKLPLTPGYMSPEACLAFLQKFRKGYKITGKTDIFSLALVVCFMHCQRDVLLSPGQPGTLIDNKYIVNMMIMTITDADYVRRMIPEQCREDMRELLWKMSEIKAEDRISADEAMKFIEGQTLHYKRKHDEDEKKCTKKGRTEGVETDIRSAYLQPISSGSSTAPSLQQTSAISGNLPDFTAIELASRPPPRRRKKTIKK